MKVRNIAAHLPDGEELFIPWNGSNIRVIKGKPVEVPDELGISLLEQVDAWAPSGEAAKAAAEKVAN